MKKTGNIDRIMFFILGLLVASTFYANLFIAFQLNNTGTQNTQSSKNTDQYFFSPQKIPIVAVHSTTNEGVVGELIIKTIPGNGNVLIDTNPFLEPDIQYSANVAVNVAKAKSHIKADDKDIVLIFNISGRLIGGPSAGAAITTAAISVLENRKIRDDVAITGTITADGKIGMVGGILEKAKAASEAGYKIFLIPEGQSRITYYEKRIEKEPFGFGFYLYNTYYVPKTIDITQEVKDKWGLEVIEVSNIDEVVNIMLE